MKFGIFYELQLPRPWVPLNQSKQLRRNKYYRGRHCSRNCPGVTPAILRKARVKWAGSA